MYIVLNNVNPRTSIKVSYAGSRLVCSITTDSYNRQAGKQAGFLSSLKITDSKASLPLKPSATSSYSHNYSVLIWFILSKNTSFVNKKPLN